jgi:hypothetical protein
MNSMVFWKESGWNGFQFRLGIISFSFSVVLPSVPVVICLDYSSRLILLSNYTMWLFIPFHTPVDNLLSTTKYAFGIHPLLLSIATIS